MTVEPSNIPQTPLDPDLAGYPTVEALKDGYRNSSVEGKRQRERADRLEALLVEREQQRLSTAPNGRPGKSPADNLSEMGVPVDSLEAYVNERVGAALAPLVNGMQARGRLVGEHPDYVQFEADVANFIAEDPDRQRSYNAMFNADPAGAMEYAFLKFGASRRRESPAPRASDPVDAGIPSSRGGDSRRAPDGSQQLQDAYEQMQRTGSQQDVQRYAKLRLRSVIKDDFLNQ